MICPAHSTRFSDPAGTGLLPAGDGRMWVEHRFREPLGQAGLAGFDAVMATSAGCRLRKLADRENWRLDLPDTQRSSRGVYLKKHRVRTWRSRLRASFSAGPGATAGRVEAENVRSLTDAGIDVMALAAYGETLRPDGWLESFLLTEELEGYAELDHFLRRRFPPLPPSCAASDPRELRRLLRQVALIVRRLHAAGYNHRDLYCCHFLVREPARGQFDIRLIDLQRVQFRRWRRHRWVVKDLAQLAFSAPQDSVTCRDKLAFFRDYLGVRRLRAADKRLIRRVLCKQRLMQRRLASKG